MRKHIANAFTLLNLVFGCLAVIQILQGLDATVGTEPKLDTVNRMQLAALFICLAGVVDFLDGLIARLLHATSEMGKQLDSLADLVSFGVAPGLIVYEFLRISYLGVGGGELNSWWLLPALLIPCAGAYRLARFNLGTSFSTTFEGLPIPAGGILIAAFPLIAAHTSFAAVQTLFSLPLFWYVLILVVSGLMVSTLPMMSLKFKNLSFSHNWPKYLLIALAVLGGLLLHWLAVPVVFMIYVILSIFLARKA